MTARKGKYESALELPFRPDLTVSEFARAVGFSTKHVREKFIRTGMVKARQYGRHYRIPYSELIRFQEEGLLKVQYRINPISADDDDDAHDDDNDGTAADGGDGGNGNGGGRKS